MFDLNRTVVICFRLFGLDGLDRKVGLRLDPLFMGHTNCTSYISLFNTLFKYNFFLTTILLYNFKLTIIKLLLSCIESRSSFWYSIV